jgi:hypothetical protein
MKINCGKTGRFQCKKPNLSNTPKPAAPITKKPKVRDTLYIAVQMGGTRGEWYASTYDKESFARSAIRGHIKATYDAIGPFEIPEALARALQTVEGAEGQFIDLIGDVCADAARENFSDGRNKKYEH